MAKDTEEQYCDLEQSLPKTTIHKPHISNGYTTILKSNNHFETEKNELIVLDDEDDIEVEEKSSTVQYRLEENGLPANNINISNGTFQLAVLREVEFNIKDTDKTIVENVVNEVKRGRGRPKGCVLKKKETLAEDEQKEKMQVDNDDGSEKKGFSLRLDFLGRYQKHKPKLKKDKSARNSIEDNSPTPKRKCGRPLNISKDYILDDSYFNNLGREAINSEVNISSRNKTSENGIPNENDLNDTDNENKDSKDKDSISSSQTNEKIINVKPISVEPRRRLGRPKGPPKPPKIKGKRGRKPNPNKSPKPLKEFKNEDENNELKIQKVPGKRGRPKIYHDRPPKIKIPGRKVGRPLGPPKPFKPKGPRGRPRLIRINTSDRPVYNPTSNTFIKSEDEDQKVENNVYQKNDRHRDGEIKIENLFDVKYHTTQTIKKKRGRPLGYSPVGKTHKRLGRPPVKTKAALLRKLKQKTGRGRGRPKKIHNLPITKNNEMIVLQNQPILNDESIIKSEITLENDEDADECSDISVTDKNWETIVEDDSESNSKIGLSAESDNDGEDDKEDSEDDDGDDNDSISNSDNSDIESQ